jgi:DNA polymerase-3 subunit gamma/tau
MSLALARKYRPKRFADVAVQSHVSNTLRGAIARGRVAHGYLLCGPRGVGKTTLARVLAMALNCENKQGDGEPCGECISCQRIWSGSSSLDVVEIDAASNRGVDDARDLRERAMYAPSGDDRYKVYIVDEAHMLTREAWNALLKILEEPPPRVIFVFATTEPQKIAQAAAPVLSRLQRFDLKRIGLSDITRRLSTVLDSEGVKASDDALSMIARAADGSMRDALSLTDQVISIGDGAVTAERVREALGLVPEDEFLAIVDIIAGHRAGEVFGAVNKLADAGVDFGVFLSGFADILRAQLTVVLNGKAEGVSATAAAALRERRDLFTAGDLLRMLSAVNALEPTFRKSSQQQLLIEMLLVRMALLDRTVALEDLLKGLGGESTAAARGESTPGSPRADVPSGSVRTQPAQASVARTAQRPATKPGYPPQLDAPNALPPSVTSKPSAPSANEGQLREMKRAMETTAQDSNRSRMTPEALKEERIGMLREKDPALGAAIDELDLELLD